MLNQAESEMISEVCLGITPFCLDHRQNGVIKNSVNIMFYGALKYSLGIKYNQPENYYPMENLS